MANSWRWLWCLLLALPVWLLLRAGLRWFLLRPEKGDRPGEGE